ncbi:MAG: leucyl/phenylalanyl-tRNA--protein transferase [Bryobacteraceae bacterium]
MDCCGVTRSITPAAVLEMYARGVFPMGSSEHEYITWHKPETRALMPLDGFHVSRSFRRTLAKTAFSVTLDQAFPEVLAACADRPEGTWITGAIARTYIELHKQGHAHSVEVWLDGSLAGGLYGVHIGAAFFAESKFHRATDMSKVALWNLTEHLRARDFILLEVQYLTAHLESLGAVEIPAHEYERRLLAAVKQPRSFDEGAAVPAAFAVP